MHYTIDRHPLRPIEFWQSKLQHLYAILQSMGEQEVQDLKKQSECELEIGICHRYLDQSGDENFNNAGEYSAALALLSVCQQRSQGFSVQIRKKDTTTRIKGAQQLTFGWPDWLSSFSLALLNGDQDVIEILSTIECIEACSLPFDKVDRFWPFLCGAMSAMVQGDELAEKLIQDAEGYMKQVAIMEVAYIEHCFQPLLQVIQALIQKDQQQLVVAAIKALDSFKNYYSNLPDGDAETSGLFHISLSALLHHGKNLGLEVEIDSAYLLKASDKPVNSNKIVAIYPTLSIFDALEAEWLMMKEGFKNHDKSIITQTEKQLFACYQAKDCSGIPNAEFKFELLNSEQNPYDGSHAQPALDIGELLHFAELFASLPVTTATGEQTYQIENAVTAIDLAHNYLQCMGGELDPSLLHSEIAKSMYDTEPGRFKSERLTVYRNALAG